MRQWMALSNILSTVRRPYTVEASGASCPLCKGGFQLELREGECLFVVVLCTE